MSGKLDRLSRRGCWLKTSKSSENKLCALILPIYTVYNWAVAFFRAQKYNSYRRKPENKREPSVVLYAFTATSTRRVELTSTSVILQFLNSFASPIMFFTVTLLFSVFA